MDVLPAEAEKLRQLLTIWSEHDDYELEATFGPKGAVDATAFFAIAARLKAKGYEAMPQEDRLNIILPERIRISLVGSGIIQQYCRDDMLNNKPYVAMIKDRTFIESNLDMEEYETRVKVRREIEMAHDDARLREVMERWQVHRKAFRLIRRWSFAGKGIQFDLSIVRQTPFDARGDFKWARTFKENNILTATPIYEVEVELKHARNTVDVDTAMKDLVRGIGEVLRGIQRNSVLIRKSMKNRALSGYKQLTGTEEFRGVAPVTLEVDNMSATIDEGVPNIRTGYNVTDKADGLRVHAFVDRRGELFLIDMSMNVYRTGLIKEACALSLLDGEWVTELKDGTGCSQLLLFDIYIGPGGTVVDQLPFVGAATDDEGGQQRGRYYEMSKWFTGWTSGDGPKVNAKGVNDTNKLMVSVKKFIAKPPGKAIFRAADKMLNRDVIYNTDGLIFTPNSAPLPSRPGETFWGQFKWKPAHDNTIDFLVNFEKDRDSTTTDKVTIGVNPETNETMRYKTMRLYVSTRKTVEEEDPRTAILFGTEALKGLENKKRGMRVSLFVPRDFPDTMAATCYKPVELDLESGDEFILTERTKEPIRDRSIVEMGYDPKRPPGWRWIPIRVRHDKTERLLQGTLRKTMNSEMVANSVWNSIHQPVTDFMIRTGSEEPSPDELKDISAYRESMAEIGKVYYDRKATQQDLALVRGLRDFHNRYIKEDILYKTVLHGGGKKLLDTSCGEGGDLQKWRRNNVSFVLGVDYSGNNIRNPDRGIYTRYMDTIKRNHPGSVAPMIFAIGDSSKKYIDGSAGATPEERDILRTVFGRVKPEGTVPPFVEKVGVGALSGGADVVASMFSIHYYFEDLTHWNGFLENISDTLKVGGYFIGCAFDGELVFNALRGLSKGQSKVGMVGDTPVWTITKQYDVDELSNNQDSLGLAIDVDFISIGTINREYLVSFDFLKAQMKTIGCELLNDEELRELGLHHSTNTFRASYDMAARGDCIYTMDDAVKEYSFYHRWYIFKRKASGPIAPEELAAVIPTAMVKPTNMGANTNTNGIPVAIPKDEAPAQTKTVKKAANKKAISAAETTEEPPLNFVQGEPITVSADRSFEPSELFQFSPDASQQDVLKIKEPAAGRWLTLIAPFAIPDPDEPSIMYPSVEHYMAAMKFKLATDKPELAKTIMSQEGRVHQKYLAQRQSETSSGARALTADRDTELLKAEAEEVRFESRPQAIARYGAAYDDSKWLAAKDKVLNDALTYRWTNDKRLRKIIEAARDQKKYLLYYTGTSSGSELGGKRRTSDGRIDGANKVGKIYMKLALYPPF